MEFVRRVGVARRSPRRALVLACLAGVAACAPSSAPAGAAPEQAPRPPAESVVREILQTMDVENVLANRAAAFTPEAALLAGDLTDAELGGLHQIVRVEFRYDTLVADVVSALAAEAPPQVLEAVLVEFTSGPTAAVTQVASEFEPTLSMEEYAQSLSTSPPTRERVALLRSWAEVQAAGTFYVLLQEALVEASYRVAGALRADTPPFQRRTGDVLSRALEASLNAATVSFLRTHETVPDEAIERSIQFFASDAGRWFAENYSVSVAEAVRAAALRVEEALRNSGVGAVGVP